MKIKGATFAEEYQIEQFLHFAHPEGRHENLIFLRRVAAYVRDHHETAWELIGRRSTAEQTILYNAYIAYLNHTGPKADPAAKPNTSKHEIGLAIDIPSERNPYLSFLSKLYNMPYSAKQQAIAKKYGLIVPLNTIDNPTQAEPWHIQPVETLGLVKLTGWLDPDDDEYLSRKTIRAGTASTLATEWSRLTGRPFTDKGIKTWQGDNDLLPDGICGPKSWAKVYANKHIIP